MSSVDNENPFGTYNYKDCSLGICSIYCPQFCYLIFPPPPPTDDGSSTPFSPLIIAIIGVLASFFLLVSYYTIVTRYCKGRNFSTQNEENRNENDHDQYHVATSGLDEAPIKMIPVRKYRKGDGLIEGTDCAVCLSEFQENEALRLLPKCRHAFHLPCIDKWLKSQSNCPLCRASVVAPAQMPPSQVTNTQTSSDFSMNSYEVRRPNDLVLVVDDQERNFDERVVRVDDGSGNDGENFEKRREHIGFDQEILICDILRFEEIYEDLQVGKFESLREVGSSKGESRFGVRKSWDMGLLRSPVAMKRSISAGRFMLTGHDHKGKSSVVSS